MGISYHRIALVVGLALLALPAGVARAESSSQAALEQRIQALRDRAELDSEKEVRWREWHLKLLRDVENARADLEEKKQAHYALRGRKWRAGKSRADYSREVEESRTILSAAEQKLDEFYLRARREGIPPGWVRPPDSSQGEAALGRRAEP